MRSKAPRRVHARRPWQGAAALVAVAVLSGCVPSVSPSPPQSPSPLPTASPWLFAFVATDSEGGFPVPVTVGDISGALSDARPATAAELAAAIARRPMEGAAGDLSMVAGSDRTILAIWAGASCDRSATVTIGAGVSSLAIAAGRPSDCTAPPTYRGVVMTFDRPVDVATIQLEVR